MRVVEITLSVSCWDYERWGYQLSISTLGVGGSSLVNPASPEQQCQPHLLQTPLAQRLNATPPPFTPSPGSSPWRPEKICNDPQIPKKIYNDLQIPEKLYNDLQILENLCNDHYMLGWVTYMSIASWPSLAQLAWPRLTQVAWTRTDHFCAEQRLSHVCRFYLSMDSRETIFPQKPKPFEKNNLTIF